MSTDFLGSMISSQVFMGYHGVNKSFLFIVPEKTTLDEFRRLFPPSNITCHRICSGAA
jgi:hypothetical protein